LVGYTESESNRQTGTDLMACFPGQPG